MKKIWIAIFLLLLIPEATAAVQKPGDGITVRPARATWTTGFFQEVLIRKGLEELGYTVEKPAMLQIAVFYKSLQMGDIDYWANSWFPSELTYLQKKEIKNIARPYGYIVKRGGLQGYLISKDVAEELNITSLEDFKRKEVRERFDKTGNGKADLTACPQGWYCEGIIDRQIRRYKLEDYITPVKAAYEASMAANVGAFKNGEPVFFYTWTPNWTTHVLKPGQDVVWINVPFNFTHATEGDEGGTQTMTIEHLEGAVTSPIKLGFVVATIRAVARIDFMDKNPAARTFIELFTIPLEDLNAQNTLMHDGEKSEKDIERHADEWIAENWEQWDSWLSKAREAHDEAQQ